MVFLWRYKGLPNSGSGGTVFGDLPSNRTYRNAIQWGAGAGITKGYMLNGKKVFGVNDYCTRGQAVVFLYRLAGQK